MVDKESCLQIAVISPTSTPPSSCQMESNLNLEIVTPNLEIVLEANHKLTFAAVSTWQPSVPTLHLTAITDTSVASAKNQVIQSQIASLERERLHRSLYPKYLHYNIWTEDSFSLLTADWTESASPLPSPPLKEMENSIVVKTISENPLLFKIITPINVDCFEFLLQDHPNQLFVASVCHGLREGFWPWADTLKEGYPITHDASLPTPKNPVEASFLHAQQKIEQQKKHFVEKTSSQACIACQFMLFKNLGHQTCVW